MEYKLINEIVKLSESKIWASAKQEWNFEHCYTNTRTQSCLCGHYPIINVCVIKNTSNKKVAEVGNCCVNRFLGIDKGNRIFEAINRLRKDISKSIGIGALEYLNSKGLLNDFEYNFYLDTIKMRKLNVKQMKVRMSINQKFLDFTSPESMATSNRINKALSFAENNKTNDISFLRSFKKYFERNGKLTECQNKCLNSLVERLKIA